MKESRLSEKKPMVCMNEKPVVLHADLRPVLSCAHLKAGRPDDRKWKTARKIRIAFAILVGFASLISGLSKTRAQMIVPVDRTLNPPQGFDFSGKWTCGAGASIARLEVENQHSSTGDATLRLSGPWTEIRESQDGFNGNYFAGYDRDKSQFLMIDADDPTSIAYFTEGWSGKKLVLTSTNGKDQSAPPHRIQYVVNDSHRFTVTWEMLEGTDWKAEPSFMCIEVEHDHR